MILDCYIEIAYFLLSIPIIYILYECSLITKETTKRERDRTYCKNDIMEMETLRYYVSNGDRKSKLSNIIIAAGIYLAVIVICMVWLFIYIFNSFNALDQLVIFCVLLLLTMILISNILILKAQNTDEYDKIMNAIRKDFSNSFSNLFKNSDDSFFSKLPDEFLKPFVERWVFAQNLKNTKTLNKRIEDIDEHYNTKFNNDSSVINFIGLLRPFENDTKYIYKVLKSDKRYSLPALEDYEFIYHNTANIEIIAWFILVFIYYNIFHIYYQDTDMFIEIMITIIVITIILMFLYYLVIARDTL